MTQKIVVEMNDDVLGSKITQMTRYELMQLLSQYQVPFSERQHDVIEVVGPTHQFILNIHPLQ